MKNLNGAGRRLLESGPRVHARPAHDRADRCRDPRARRRRAHELARPSHLLAAVHRASSASDASGVVAQLAKDKVDYQLSDGGATILVPADKVDAERLAAASAGLPSSSTTGYALLDNMGVTASEFQQNVTYKRAIEGELAKTIELDQRRRGRLRPARDPAADRLQRQAAGPDRVGVRERRDPPHDRPGAGDRAPHRRAPTRASRTRTCPSSTRRARRSPRSAAPRPAAPPSRRRATRTRPARKVQAVLDSLLGPGNSTVTVAADREPVLRHDDEQDLLDADRRPGAVAEQQHLDLQGQRRERRRGRARHRHRPAPRRAPAAARTPTRRTRA